METDYLRDFLIFSETMNYTTAAKRLYMSQPTLSSRIASLEKTIGVPLLEKTGGELMLTEAGRNLLGDGRGILQLIDSAISECEHIHESVVSLNIRSDTAYFDSVLSLAKREYEEENPGKEIRFRTHMPHCSRAEALDKGLIDFDIGRYLNLEQSQSSCDDIYKIDGLDCFLQVVEPQGFLDHTRKRSFQPWKHRGKRPQRKNASSDSR